MPRYNDDDEQFEDSTDLVSLTKQILALNIPELKDARKAKFDIVFSKREVKNSTGSMHKGGQCRKVEGSIRFKTKLDFVITVYHIEFSAMNDHNRVKTLVHELHHIGFKPGTQKPFVRGHTEEFCEILAHDSMSETITKQIITSLKVPVFANVTGTNFTMIDGIRVYHK